MPRHLSLSKVRKPLPDSNGSPGLTSLDGYTNGVNGTNDTKKHENGDNGYTDHYQKGPNGVNGLSEQHHRPRLLVLSAADEDGIARQADAFSRSLDAWLPADGQEEDVLDDITFTLNRHRTMFDWKSYGIVESLSGLSGLAQSLSTPMRRSNIKSPQLGLIFTGQGAQWPRIGHELLTWPVFKASLMRTQHDLYRMECKSRIIDELTAEGANSRIDIPEFSQAITTAVQIALVELLKSMDAKPAVLVGHSSGAIAAAYCAGHLSREIAMRVSYYRGILSSHLALESTQKFRIASVGLASSKLPGERTGVKMISSVKPCGSASKRNFETYGIPEDHIFCSRNASFADGIKRMTKGKGVDVILNSPYGKLLVASWEVVAEFGRFIEIGRKDIGARGYLPMFHFIKNTSFSGVDLVAMVGRSSNDMLKESLT
jgi:hypothetical protein